mgnify:CR=1 FL=1
MGGLLAVIYGAISYVIFLVTFLYAIGFVGNFAVPKTIDSGVAGDILPALVINLALLSVFAVQHSVMARPGFKKVWTRIVPESIERSTYVLLSSLALILLFAYWQPMPGIVWDMSGTLAGTVLYALFWLGWAMVLVSTFLINHFNLFGLQQIYRKWRDEPMPTLNFVTPLLYKLVRHPIMLGFIIAFWATPVMSVGHLLFALVTTAYTVVGVLFEERDLVAGLGADYRDYQKRVPMLIPFTKKGK